MYDIDAGRSHALRLDGPTRQDLYSERADVRRQMEALSLRFCDLTMQIDAMERQARPIPVSQPILSASNDFWDHRHYVMAGTTAKVARANGRIDLMTAAAAGEIEDPAAGLRRERN